VNPLLQKSFLLRAVKVAKAVKVESASTGDGDVDYVTTLGLMKGHLIVAKELMAQGLQASRAPHWASGGRTIRGCGG